MAVWARLCLMSKAAMQHSVTDFKKRGMTFTVVDCPPHACCLFSSSLYITSVSPHSNEEPRKVVIGSCTATEWLCGFGKIRLRFLGLCFFTIATKGRD